MAFNPSTYQKTKQWYPIYSLGTFETIVGGSFLPQGSSAPVLPTITTSASNPPYFGASVFSVSRTATGRFLVTLAGGWSTTTAAQGILSASKVKTVQVSLGMYQLTQIKVSAGAFNTATGAFEVDVLDPTTGALTDIAAHANNVIFWRLRQTIGGPKNIQNI